MKPVRVAVIAIGMTIIGLTSGYFIGKRSAGYPKPTALDCAFYKMESYVTPDGGAEVVLGQPTSWPTERREGRTNEQIIAYLHNNYPEPEMNNKTLGFDCPKGFDYTSLYFPGDVVKEVEVGGLYVGTCLPVKSSVPVVDHQEMRWKAIPQIYGPTDRVGQAPIACDPTWNKDGKPVCSQDAQPDPLPQYTKPDTTTFEGLTPPSGSSDYQNYCDSYPKEPKVKAPKVPTYGLKYWVFEDPDTGNQTTPYHPSFPKEPNPKVKPKECKPTPYWVICDDGFVIFGKAISDDSLRARVCGKHGGVDNRQIHTVATLGKDWKVIVTPINPPTSISDMPDILHYKDH